MQIKVSKGNNKLGNVPNLSLTPGKSCVEKVPCWDDGCYARNAYRRLTNVRTAWDSNLKMYNESPNVFFMQLYSWLEKYQPARFRFFVGGDFPDEDFYWSTEDVVGQFPDTEFLVFTKRYEWNYAAKPENLQIILSTWPGYPLPKNTDLPWSWLESDPRNPDHYFRCPGGCRSCQYRCWCKLDAKTHVVFPKH